MIASAISFRRGAVLCGEFLRGEPLRGELWTLAILLFFTVNPCARHCALRFTGWVSPIFFFPSAFERGGSSGDRSFGTSLPESNRVELEGRVTMRPFGGGGSVSSKYWILTSWSLLDSELFSLCSFEAVR
ncbi:hypothetical protein F2Q70_00034484 [Brassica cretica]|uniref:Uncharacterized protein n=1 Tax=Brassica cretica TaxID=69181 RepID=A0A8S9JQA0_BRACR|nr:hypothetical protein F2Q70_00034484 [Brassica cretica]